MPKITQAHKDRQIQKILAAAEECFAQEGFRGASMDKIIKTAKMSSSTVYRYFPEGKQSLINTISNSRFDPLIGLVSDFGKIQTPPSPTEALKNALKILWVCDDITNDHPNILRSARLAVGAWFEAAQDPNLQAGFISHIKKVDQELQLLLKNWQTEGTVTSKLSPEELSQLILSSIMGLVAEIAIVGQVDIQGHIERLNKLLAS